MRTHGRDMQGRTPDAFCRAGLARTFETARIFGDLTVADNVRFAHLFGNQDKPAASAAPAPGCLAPGWASPARFATPYKTAGTVSTGSGSTALQPWAAMSWFASAGLRPAERSSDSVM